MFANGYKCNSPQRSTVSYLVLPETSAALLFINYYSSTFHQLFKLLSVKLFLCHGSESIFINFTTYSCVIWFSVVKEILSINLYTTLPYDFGISYFFFLSTQKLVGLQLLPICRQPVDDHILSSVFYPIHPSLYSCLCLLYTSFHYLIYRPRIPYVIHIAEHQTD